MVIKYCVKRRREQDGKTYYTNIFSHIKQVEMCIEKHEKIYEIDVNETKEINEDSYYGWLEPEGDISYVYPHLALVSVCFTYGYEAEEKRGRGKVIRVKIEEKCEVSKR